MLELQLLGHDVVSADPALKQRLKQGKRRVKQRLPLKSSSNVSIPLKSSSNVSNDFFQSTFFHRFPEMLSFNVIFALTPSLLFFFFFFFFFLGKSPRGEVAAPIITSAHPCLDVPGPHAPTVEVCGWPQKSMEHRSTTIPTQMTRKSAYMLPNRAQK